jgi:hypothetical protein
MNPKISSGCRDEMLALKSFAFGPQMARGACGRRPSIENLLRRLSEGQSDLLHDARKFHAFSATRFAESSLPGCSFQFLVRSSTASSIEMRMHLCIDSD